MLKAPITARIRPDDSTTELGSSRDDRAFHEGGHVNSSASQAEYMTRIWGVVDRAQQRPHGRGHAWLVEVTGRMVRVQLTAMVSSRRNRKFVLFEAPP